MSNLNSLLEDFYEEDNKNNKAPLNEEQIDQFRSVIEEILDQYHNDEYDLGFSIADWDDKDPETEDNNSMYHFRYIPESGEEGTVSRQDERFEFTISGGLNGAGNWEDYLDDLANIFKDIKDRTGWEPVAVKMENDVCDDLFDIQLAVYNIADLEATAESLKEGCWNMPTTVAEANKLKKLMSHKVDAFSVGDCYCANDELGIGDDTLFDEIGKWRKKYGYGSKKSNDCRKVIRDFIKNNVLPGWDNYTYASPEGNADGKIWEPGVKEIYQEIADMKLNEAYNDDLDEDIEKHDELNPKLFENNKLKPEIVDKINEIVDVFLESLEEDEIKIDVEDIILVGSNVSYNYTKDSDLDIHIIANTENLECPDNLYPLLYGAYKSLFNKKMNINFYGIPVEVYVETDDTPLRSNGIYSVKDNDWIKEPVLEDIPDIDVDAVYAEVQPFENRYKEIMENPSVDDIDQLITDIYDKRKEGMSKVDGEYSIPNLTFKEFRNRGYLDDLKELRAEVLSDELSLENFASKAETQFPLDESFLSNSDIYAYRIKIQQVTGHQGLVFNNGHFTINNLREDEVDNILYRLNKEDFVKNCHKIASGKWDFNHMKYMNVPSRYYTINGEIDKD